MPSPVFRLGTPVELEIIFEVAPRRRWLTEALNWFRRCLPPPRPWKQFSMKYPTFYRMIHIDGLLHLLLRSRSERCGKTSLPSWTSVFIANVRTALRATFRSLSPGCAGLPGLRHSDARSRMNSCTCSITIAEIMNHFTETLGLSRYTLYMQDYGGAGWVSNGPGSSGMDRSTDRSRRSCAQRRSGCESENAASIFGRSRGKRKCTSLNLLSLATTRTRHVGDDPNVERYDPDLWTDEFYFLNQPGQADIQSDLFYDYRTNADSYPKWQAWMREKEPRLLVIWGKYDFSFELAEPESYRRTCRMLKSTFWTQDISRSTLLRIKLRSSSVAS